MPQVTITFNHGDCFPLRWLIRGADADMVLSVWDSDLRVTGSHMTGCGIWVWNEPPECGLQLRVQDLFPTLQVTRVRHEQI